MVLRSWAGVEHSISPGLQSLRGVGAGCRTLGPSGLVRRPGAGDHSGSVHFLQMSGNLLEGTAPLTAGAGWWFHRSMAGNPHSLDVLCPSLLIIVSLAVSNC